MGPLDRLNQFKAIETSAEFFGLQQLRWPPTNIANTVEEAVARLFMVFEGGDEFGAGLVGQQEVPPVSTTARALAEFELNDDGTLSFELRATGPIQNATAAHIHLGGRGQNGPVVAFLFEATTPKNFRSGDRIARGTLSDGDVIARTG